MYWLIKSEPSTYSYDDLTRDKRTEWTGVRNFEARNNMKKMAKGDQLFFYHSGDEKSIVGIAKVVVLAHPDSTDTTGAWHCVDIAPVKKLSRPISLEEIKKISTCKNMALVRKGRLSVGPVTEEEWGVIAGLE